MCRKNETVFLSNCSASDTAAAITQDNCVIFISKKRKARIIKEFDLSQSLDSFPALLVFSFLTNQVDLLDRPKKEIQKFPLGRNHY
jgi:hypothetical protein